MIRYRLQIDGMTCEACARHLRHSLESLPGVTASVSYPRGEAWIEAPPGTPPARLLDAVREAGYRGVVTRRGGEGSPREGSARIHIAIVGSGSAAFAAALRAVERGAEVTLIERQGRIGGTCVNVGCVPSKFLIRAAQTAWHASHHPFDGIARAPLRVERPRLLARQQALVEKLREKKYEEILASHADIRLIRGEARFTAPLTLSVSRAEGGEEEITADRILLATGSRPHVPPVPGLSETPFWTSTEALESDIVPQHLVVIGGSVVALELAQAFLHLGSRVTLVARSRLLSRSEPLLGERLAALLREEGMEVITHTVPTEVSHDGDAFHILLPHGTVTADRLLVASGRVPNTDRLALERAGVDTDPHGAVEVNERLETSAPGVYAAGDCTTLPRYVYVAAAAGTRAAVNMTGGDARLDLSVLPTVVFTEPAVAEVGLREEEAISRGLQAESRVLELEHLPRAQVELDTRGFIKLVAEKGSGRLLGAQILATEGGELIQSAALAIRAGMTVADLADQLHPYLTRVEGLRLCAQTFERDPASLSCCAG
ncbi:MAG TPA: mercury(II) reductase [Thiotrichales bacterium]|nr:mercury(II) reductase [Thiotrichales bacterium]